ncbi:predicted protein [Nematostella vectensis]|uniref:Eukaryotic translation initiation factor 5 n=1 Tax=Nematostella vectensis TaxID=45351 RepID=A7RZU8_NEMVE|nr:predicted protein [Nematostella vectensis]|eukprot:XP_001635117.1 predicted protein [Nematostella vectensis]
MALVNVNRKNMDQFYRYKMPKLIAKVEGKGNGIKTVIVNMPDIAKALSRPPSYPTKYFGCELGAQTQIDLKNERYIVNGAHQADKLQEILDGFIERFVLCSSCENPETVLVVDTRKERIGQNCKACGHQGFINLQHRLITYICRNPPTGETGTPDKKERRKKNQNGESSPTHTENQTNGVDKFDIPEINNHVSGSTTTIHASAEDDWCVDTSEAAVQRRMEDLTSGVKGLTFTDDLERPEEQRFNMLYEFVKSKKELGKVDMTGKEIVAEAERLDVRDKAVLAISEIMFDAHMLKQIPKYRMIFLRFVNENHKAQKYLLGAFEMLVGKSYPKELMPKAAHILKALYDNDLIEEEIVLQWAEKVSKKYVSKEISTQIHEKVKPFVHWLKEAEEEESSEEEDEEEDDDLVYDNKAEQLKVVVEKQPQQAIEEDEDFDIDAI